MAGNAREAGRSTTSRLLAVLGAFSAASPELGLTEVAARSGLPKTTTHRLIHELVDGGALVETSPGRYIVGLRMWKLGLLASVNASLRDIAHPYLEDLHRATGENVQLAILDTDAALLVEHIHGSASVGTLSRVGRRIPLHATAVGKVLCAFSEDARAAVMSKPLRRYTESTIVDHRRLATSLRRVRTSGVAYVFDEMSPGATSVAAPIIDQAGEVRAALSLVLRTGEVNPYRLAAALRTAAFGIGRQLAPFR